MKASYKKSGDNYLPVIIHTTGERETRHGDQLVTIATAKKYAQIEINRRNHMQAEINRRNN